MTPKARKLCDEMTHSQALLCALTGPKQFVQLQETCSPLGSELRLAVQNLMENDSDLAEEYVAWHEKRVETLADAVAELEGE